jgi:hypothetical protein
MGVATWASLIHVPAQVDDAEEAERCIHEAKAALNQPTFWQGLLWTLYSLYAVWPAALFAKGLRIAHKLSLPRAVALGIAGVFTYQGVSLAFNH